MRMSLKWLSMVSRLGGEGTDNKIGGTIRRDEAIVSLNNKEESMQGGEEMGKLKVE